MIPLVQSPKIGKTKYVLQKYTDGNGWRQGKDQNPKG